MAVDYSSRSVADATRFTANTPHAHAKAPSSPNPSSSQPSSSSRSKTPSSPRPSPPNRNPPPPPPSPETMEERVRRLRAAHLAARRHETSRFDRIVDVSRRYFDAAHKITVLGLIGFSGLALFVTIYATADMMIYNRKRRNEFFAVQQQLRSDSLEAARLAYMTGAASPEQVALVEEAESRARQSGAALPPLLSSPRPAAAAAATTEMVGRSAWPGEAMAESSVSGADDQPQATEEKQKRAGLSGWLFGGLKREEEPLNFDAEAAAAGLGPKSGGGGALDEGLKSKAKAAFEQERENQRNGGPLDQLGKPSAEEKKKGWW
ncbi:hypothetical protein F4804DRAFT_305631 [Jackrogersella minutella]|nr:hypothetical protein F4804DRAFT_305631 [Jackrogersella minutella]